MALLSTSKRPCQYRCPKFHFDRKHFKLMTSVQFVIFFVIGIIVLSQTILKCRTKTESSSKVFGGRYRNIRREFLNNTIHFYGLCRRYTHMFMDFRSLRAEYLGKLLGQKHRNSTKRYMSNSWST